MKSTIATVVLLVFAVPAAAEVPATPRMLVFCAPGYAGDTESAQPTMDLFASAVASAAGWPAGNLQAVYHQTERGGLDRIAGEDAALAIVSLSFLLRAGERLGLRPKLLIEMFSEGGGVWSLAARRGALSSAA